MNFGKIIPAALAVTVFVFLLDYLFYGILMADFFTPNGDMLETPRFLWLAIACLVFGFFFVHYYLTSHGDGSKVAEGFKHGAFMGLLVFGTVGLIMFAISKSGVLSETFVDIIYRIVQGGIAGIIVAYITGLPDGDGDREGVTPKGGGGATPPPPPSPPTGGGGGGGN